MLETSGLWIDRLARFIAVLGGIVLTAIAIMTGISIVGRGLIGLGLKPVPGDFELVEAGSAFVVAAFLPWCQLRRGHASVTILTDLFGKRVNMFLDVVADVLLFGVAVLLTWRHIAGMLDKQLYGETTFILQFPLWWAYAGALVGLVAWIIVGAWASLASIHAFSTGKERGLEDTGVIH